MDLCMPPLLPRSPRAARGRFRRRRPRGWPGARAAGVLSPPPRRGLAGDSPRDGAPCPAIAAFRCIPASPGLSGAAPPASPPEAGAQSRSPRPPPKSPTPGQRCPPGKAGPGRAPASPFSPDSFDPRTLRRTSAPGLLGSARGGPGNCPQLISFHQAALGALKPRSQ